MILNNLISRSFYLVNRTTGSCIKNNLVMMMKENISLAIIIPYYKISHFEVLLEALTKQTNQDFSVYVGNDCSPANPEHIIEKYYEKLHLKYHKFSARLGHVSLTQQWNRCLNLVNGEEWVWILPDDDLPSPNCVEEFYRALDMVDKFNIKIFRLPLEIIDYHGSVLNKIGESAPAIETNYEFYSRVVVGKAASSLGDNIFNKRALVATGGFVDFPKAWGSDHATVLRVSSGGSISFLKNAKLGFRMSGENISSDISDGVEKITARIMFAKWMKNNESIFSQKPESGFYKRFYKKGEYYFVHEWPFSFRIWFKMYKLSVICYESFSPLPIIKLLVVKCMKHLPRLIRPDSLSCTF